MAFDGFHGFPRAYSNKDDKRPFHERPVVLEPLPKFALTDKRRFGDDGGYRDVRINDNGEEMVNMANEVNCRPPYDGGVRLVDGMYDPSLFLPGGTSDHGVYARRSLVEGVKKANRLLDQKYPGAEIVVVDAFRSVKRQALGFNMVLNQVLQGDMNPSLPRLHELGLKADGVFSSVRADRQDPIAREFIDDMMEDQTLKSIAQATHKSLEDVVHELLDMAANVRYAVKSKSPLETPAVPLNMDVPLVFSNNAHAGGGAIDAFLFMNGKLANAQIPYDYVGMKGVPGLSPDDVGVQGAMDYMENDDNYFEYSRQVRVNFQLQTHLRRVFGLSNEATVSDILKKVTRDWWNQCRDYQRIFFHTMLAVGSTMFSDTQANRTDNWGGENWHCEPPPLGKDGRPMRGGNPGRSLQTMGKSRAVATWGGVHAHEQLRKKGLLDY